MIFNTIIFFIFVNKIKLQKRTGAEIINLFEGKPLPEDRLCADRVKILNGLGEI